MREAWRELMFADTEQAAKATRDPVAPAQRSDKALRKLASGELRDASPVHSCATLLEDLSRIVRNTCRTPNPADAEPTFEVLTSANTAQRRTLDLIALIRLQTEHTPRTSS